MVSAKKGFTLLEIIAVTTLLLVIASITIPNYMHIVDKQKLKIDLAEAINLNETSKMYYIENKDNICTDDLETYLKKFYEEMPYSKYFNEEFSLKMDNNGKTTISAGGIIFVEEGKVKEVKDIFTEIEDFESI